MHRVVAVILELFAHFSNPFEAHPIFEADHIRNHIAIRYTYSIMIWIAWHVWEFVGKKICQLPRHSSKLTKSHKYDFA